MNRIALTILVVSILASCSKKPKESISSPTPAVTDSIPETSIPIEITEPQITTKDVVRCIQNEIDDLWWENSKDNNFEPFQDGKRENTPYRNGTWYLWTGTLWELGKKLDHDGDANNYNAIMRVAIGRPLFLKTPDQDSALFYFVNPEAIQWMADHLIPAPSTKLGGLTFKVFYDQSFSRISRMMIISHQFIDGNHLEVEATKYGEAMRSQDFIGQEYLAGRFEKPMSALYKNHADFVNTGYQSLPIFTGFWLRRKIDGSYDAVYTALYSIMEQYDKKWMKASLPAK